MTEFTVVALRFGLFIAMWVFVFMVAGVLSRDLFGPRKVKAGKRRKRAKAQQSAPATQQPVGAGAAAGTAAPDAHHQASDFASELVVTSGPLSGTVIALGDAPITLGRSRENTLVLDDDFASGFHAKIGPDGRGGWYVEDLGSTNGTFMGQHQLEAPTSLGVHMPVTIGNTTVELRS
ncbi:FHA domain-containing protein [Brevibacterium sp. UMB1308A]|uniref:FHA domain-containing protein FhaB/FipA n=1 Tax=Brevibacterium sp. UMB1308A TaxID=3050608 RepID=UPI00254DBD89|nr:FHA domain-containing protein [Brevibacterium sp. UMB1308A]MDK8346725.1 FHA domain-containing protein [Brevibacterium sp. UMB1308B]MDK8714065.1 FHA domain-containing protein [Brevibacterium sp. UMB1308A]